MEQWGFHVVHPYPLQELSAQVEAASSHGADDEMVRGHTLTLLKLWTIRCHDNIESIDREVPMLREMERRRGLKAEASGGEVSPPREKKPWKPIVITREMLQVCLCVCVCVCACVQCQ